MNQGLVKHVVGVDIKSWKRCFGTNEIFDANIMALSWPGARDRWSLTNNNGMYKHQVAHDELGFVANTMGFSWPRIIDRSPSVKSDGLYKFEAEHDELRLAPDSSSTLEADHTSAEKLVRKVDLRLLPILGLLYAISLVDRVNVSCSLTQGELMLNV